MEAPSATLTVEFFDALAGASKRYTLQYWARDGSVSVYDFERHRPFLQRSVPAEALKPAHLREGATVLINGRAFRIVAVLQGAAPPASLLLVGPRGYADIGKVLRLLTDGGLALGRMCLQRWTANDAAAFQAASRSSSSATTTSGRAVDDGYAGLVGDVFAVEVTGDDAVERLRALAGNDGLAQGCGGSIRCAGGARIAA
jgi:nucleoside diphosphate kinase